MDKILKNMLIGGKIYYSLDIAVDEDTSSKRIIVTDSEDLISRYLSNGVLEMSNRNVYILPYSAFTDKRVDGVPLEDLVLPKFNGKPIDLIKYTHYRSDGEEYQVLGTGFDVLKKKEFVLYKALYKGEYEYGTIWLRDMELFFGNVVSSDYAGPRFNPVK